MAKVTDTLAFLVTMNADQAIKAMTKVGDTADKELGQGVEDRLEQTSKQMTKFGAIALTTSGIAARGLKTLGEAAAAQNAAVAANAQVLGESSAAIQEWAEGSVRAVGLSRTAAITAATTFGSFGKTMGLATDELVGFATEQVALAADMAAFKDVSPEQALQDLAAAYAGSRETLRKYNIQVNENALKTAYFRETGEQVTGTLTAQQRTIALHAEVMRQSADMTGQWNRESGELLGQQVQLSATIEDLKANVGQGLLPVLTDVTSGANQAAAAFAGLSPEVQSGVGTFAGYATAAVGVSGALSLAGSQAIKMRDNLTTLADDGTRSLNKAGKAAAGFGVALAALAAYDIASTVFDVVTDRADKAADAYNEATVAIGEGSEDAAKKMLLAAEASETMFDRIAEAQRYSPVGSILAEQLDGQRIAIDGMIISADNLRAHLDALNTQNPEFGQAGIDNLRAYADGLDRNSDGYRQLIGLLDDAEQSFGLQTAAADALAGGLDGLTGELDDTAASIGEVERSGGGGAFGDLADEATRAATNARNLTAELSDFQDLLGDLADEEGLLRLADEFDTIAVRAAEAAEAASTPDAEQAARDHELAVISLRENVIEYAASLEDVPEEAVTDIDALIDEGAYEEAERRLNELVRARTLNVSVSTIQSLDRRDSAAANRQGLTGTRAHGGNVASREPYLVGERGPEVVEFDQPGRVIPTHELGAASAAVTIGTVNVMGEPFGDGLRRAMALAGRR